MTHPLCFVLMPFGRKPVAGGGTVDFDTVYRDLIAPAIADAELDPLRADEEMTGSIIHKPVFEWLILCHYAVADLTTVNASVFYELGLRGGALCLAAVAGLIPLLSQFELLAANTTHVTAAGTSAPLLLFQPAWSAVALTLVGLLIAADRFFGFSTT
jgi:hypothetical protein